MFQELKKLFAYGLISGLVGSLSLLYWVFRPGTHVDGFLPREPAAEKAGDFSLGFQFEAIPSVSKKPLSVDELAKKLGFANGDEALKAAGVLHSQVRLGVLTPAWRERCVGTQPKVLCDIVEDYLGPKMMPALRGEIPRKVRRSSAPFVSKFINQLQAEDFNLQTRRSPDWTFKQVKAMSTFALKSQGCPRSFSFTLARELESSLKTPEAWDLMDKLDSHGLECLKSEEPWAEPLLLKIAVLKVARKLWKEAIPLLERALSTQSRKEEFRALYWLSEARMHAGLIAEARSTRELLWKSYPLSWHTILSRIEDGTDPLQGIRNRNMYTDEYESGDALLDKRAAWLQLLMASTEDPNGFVVRHYGEFVVRSFQPTVRSGFVQHLARLFNNAGLYRLQILALSNMAFNRPETVTLETLRLLYPRPFFEEIQNAKHIDSAIILGLARQESGFDPSATSKANAQGLLQILPSTARTLKKSRGKKLYDYSDNIALGSQYILKLSQSFNGSIEKTLASYNAGQTVVGKWQSRYSFVQDPQIFSDLIPYKETREYVPNILRNAYWYHRLFPELTRDLGADTVTSSTLKTILKVQLPKSGAEPKPASVNK